MCTKWTAELIFPSRTFFFRGRSTLIKILILNKKIVISSFQKFSLQLFLSFCFIIGIQVRELQMLSVIFRLIPKLNFQHSLQSQWFIRSTFYSFSLALSIALDKMIKRSTKSWLNTSIHCEIQCLLTCK